MDDRDIETSPNDDENRRDSAPNDSRATTETSGTHIPSQVTVAAQSSIHKQSYSLSRSNVPLQIPYEVGQRLLLLDGQGAGGNLSLDVRTLFIDAPNGEFTFSCVMEVTTSDFPQAGSDAQTAVIKIFDHTQAAEFRKLYNCPSFTAQRERLLSNMLASGKYSLLHDWLLEPLAEDFVENSEACVAHLEEECFMTEEELMQKLVQRSDLLALGLRDRELLPYVRDEVDFPLEDIEEMEEGFLYFQMRQMFQHEVTMFDQLRSSGLKGRIPQLLAVGRVQSPASLAVEESGRICHMAILMEKMQGIPCAVLGTQRPGVQGIVIRLNQHDVLVEAFREVITLIHLFWHYGMQYGDFHASNLLLRIEKYSTTVQPVLVDLGALRCLRSYQQGYKARNLDTQSTIGTFGMVDVDEGLEEEAIQVLVDGLPSMVAQCLDPSRWTSGRFKDFPDDPFITLLWRVVMEDIFRAWTPHDAFNMAMMNLEAMQCARDIMAAELANASLHGVWIERALARLVLIFAPPTASIRQLLVSIAATLKTFRKCIAQVIPDLLVRDVSGFACLWEYQVSQRRAKTSRQRRTRHVSFYATQETRVNAARPRKRFDDLDDPTPLHHLLPFLCHQCSIPDSSSLPPYISIDITAQCLQGQHIFQSLFWHDTEMSAFDMRSIMSNNIERWAYLGTDAGIEAR